jgi:hypothetical protein
MLSCWKGNYTDIPAKGRSYSWPQNHIFVLVNLFFTFNKAVIFYLPYHYCAAWCEVLLGSDSSSEEIYKWSYINRPFR